MVRIDWKVITSGLISAIILVLAFINRAWIADAFSLLGQAQPFSLVLAFGLIGFSYLVSAQVFNIVLHSLGYRMHIMRLWLTALVAIVISQSFPAGGVGSYAFLMSNFNRRGVSTGESALLASLETLSYAVAMLLVFSFSIVYLSLHGSGTGQASLVAGAMALWVIAAAVFVLTRREVTLRNWFTSIERLLGRILSREWHGARAERIVADLARARGLLASRRRDAVLLVLVQLTALSGHSLAMLLVIHSLGVSISFAVVLAAFGIALITSTFNVLPGGGGTVEAVLVALLTQMGVGPAAVPAAIIFRLFNFWLMAPIAAIGYHWLMHESAPPLVSRYRRKRTVER
jgi:uncharacterized protein (TIRG00374 family)